MDEKKKRLLTFFALCAPIYFGTMFYMTYTAPPPSPASTGPATSPTAGRGGESLPAGGVGATALEPGGVETGVQGTAPSSSAGSVRPRPEDVTLHHVRTSSFDITFSPVGGVPVRWDIIDPTYVHANGAAEPAAKDGNPDARVKGAIGLIDPALDPRGLERPFEIILKELHARYFKELNTVVYEVSETKDEAGNITVSLTSPVSDSGIQAIKRFVIPASGFFCSLEIELINRGTSNISFNNEGQGLGLSLGPGLGIPETSAGGGIFSGGDRYAYTTPVFYTARQGIEQNAVDEDSAPRVINGGDTGIRWAGIHDRYFMMTLAPRPDADSAGRAEPGFSAALVRNAPAIFERALIPSIKDLKFYPCVELYRPPLVLAAGASAKFAHDLYVGPKDRRELKKSELDLSRITFFQGAFPGSESWAWMRALCIGLNAMLDGFHALLRSWGIAIIVLVILIRLAMFPLTQIQMKHQAQMMAQQAKLKPHLDKINEKYKDNPQKKSQETLKLYQQHGVNPLGAFKGCIWMIIQLPIFVALYRILSQSIDLRGAEFLWIDDLSQPDRLFSWGVSLPLLGSGFNLLPILTAGTQILVSRVMMANNPAAADNPMQKQMMYMMPVMILFMTYGFPSGLVLYWLISNVWSIFQQKLVNRKYMPQPAAAATA